jgi:hypothetical protein
MQSATAKKITKSSSSFSRRTKSATARVGAIVTVLRSKGTLTPTRLDAIVKEHGGRTLTAEEKRKFRRFAKDPYP